MINRRGILCVLAVFTVFMINSSAFASDVPAWYVEDFKNNQAILEPGTTTYCDKDFMVQNMGDEFAEVHVILGNGANYTWDMLAPKATKSYSLTADSPFSGGWEGAKHIRIDDARIVNSTGGDAKIRVLCKK